MKAFITILLIAVGVQVFAQTVVKGKVTDEHGATIPGANIFLQDTYDGASSDVNGFFEFTTTETGAHILVVTVVGYDDAIRPVALKGEPVTIDVQMTEAFKELETVTISAGSFTANDESRRTIFKAIDIATTAGATADIAGALNTLPGTQKVGETGRLFVRGGDGNEVRTFIDGMLVMNPYQSSAPNTPSRGRFLPFMFKGTSFSTGGYSAEYGQALSSTLVLDSKDKGEATRTDIGLLSVGGDVAHAQVWDHASLAGKVQYTNVRPYFNLINQEIDWITPPESIEGSVAFRHEVRKTGMLKVYGKFNHTNYSLYNHDIDDPSRKQQYDLTNDYRYVNVAYKDVLAKDWTIRGGVSFTDMSDDLMEGDTHRDEHEMDLHGKAVVEGWLTDRIELKTGAEVINREYDEAIEPLNEGKEVHEFTEMLASTFVEGSIYFSNRFVTRGGARVEYNSLLGSVNVDPRVSMGYQVGEGSFSLAYGKFRQSPANDLLRSDKSIDSEKADHYILSYQLVNDNRTFRTEVYYKKYNDLAKYGDAAQTTLNNNGHGYARGFELFWRDNRSVKNLDYWLSYSYLDTERDYLDFPHSAVPTFASAHNFSVVYKYFFTKLRTQFGATYSFTSGRPYNNPNEDVFNGGKTKSYRDLSINVAYLPKPNLIIYFSATNVLGHDNIFGYEYSNRADENGFYNSRAIRQPAKRFLFLGVFLTLSKEKSINQLPSL